MKFYIKLLAVFIIMAMILVPTMTSCGTKDCEDDCECEDCKPEEDEPVEKVHKVGLVYSGPLFGSTHNMMWEAARQQLERNENIETCYVENVFVSNFREAVDLLVDRGVTIIVSTNHAFFEIAEVVSLSHKEVMFISFGGNTLMTNLTTFKPLLHQPANVGGLVASLNSEAPAFGIVADPYSFNVYGVINSYVIGIKQLLDRTVNIRLNYALSEYEEDIKRAIDNLVENGIDTIMLYLETDFGIRYCEQIGVNYIAYSGNLPDIELAENVYPTRYMTGFFFNANAYLTEQVRRIRNDMFVPVATIGGMDTGHAMLTELNPNENRVEPYTKVLTDEFIRMLVVRDRIFTGLIRDNRGQIQAESGAVLSFAEILNIMWLEFSITDVANFSEGRTSIPFVPLVVVGEWAEDDPRHNIKPPGQYETATAAE
jgi:hypothetical protein